VGELLVKFYQHIKDQVDEVSRNLLQNWKSFHRQQTERKEYNKEGSGVVSELDQFKNWKVCL
jgi:site-specific DNA-adenine methylase